MGPPPGRAQGTVADGGLGTRSSLWIFAVFWCGGVELLGWPWLAGDLPLVCTADPLMAPL
jgi:hypothetical protein